jgi:predicted metal-dependent phosphoesterase TrpH
MVDRGYVRSIDEAFDRYLAQGKPGYVDKYRISCQQAIDIIRGAGGVAVLAHPYLLSVKEEGTIENLILSLKEMGLQGLEVYYPEHPPQETAFYEKMAKTHQLLMTGGTDFHGSIKPEIKMGTGDGHFFVPYKIYEDLIANLHRRG